MSADGGGLRRLTHSGGGAWRPVWSPDGKRIAYAGRENAEGHAGIYVMNADGAKPHRLTPGSVDDTGPAWSPDGRKIAFDCARSGGIDRICSMNADGSDQRQLTAGGTFSESPAWSPNGRQIAFDSVRSGHSGIYVMNADGTGQRLLAP
jgi:TolB protein